MDEVRVVETLNDDAIKDSAAVRAALLANQDHPNLFDSPDRHQKLED